MNGNAFSGDSDTFGILCGLFAAVMYAFMVIFNKKADSITGFENSTLQLFISFITVAIFVGLKQGYAMKISAESILQFYCLGCLIQDSDVTYIFLQSAIFLFRVLQSADI